MILLFLFFVVPLSKRIPFSKYLRSMKESKLDLNEHIAFTLIKVNKMIALIKKYQIIDIPFQRYTRFL